MGPLPGRRSARCCRSSLRSSYSHLVLLLHRLIHTRLLSVGCIRWHHLTVTPVAWSNNSDRLIDNLFLQSYWLVAHFLVPAAPAVLLAHKLYDQVTGVVGHCGYEHGGTWCRPPSPLVGVTHPISTTGISSAITATHFTWWDRVMGTLHPDHDAELRQSRQTSAERAPRAAGGRPREPLWTYDYVTRKAESPGLELGRASPHVRARG
jgi:hypothetical protein